MQTLNLLRYRIDTTGLIREIAGLSQEDSDLSELDRPTLCRLILTLAAECAKYQSVSVN